MVGLTPLLWKSCGLIIQSWLFGSPRVEINYPLFWHSSPSHYWHYIWKLSHLLGSILWFMIPTKKRNGDQIRSSFDESSYYSHYHSSHVWSVAGMQCKAILIKKMFTNVWYLFQNISSPWSTVATPCNASCGGGIEVKVRSCTNPRPQVGMMMSRFLNFTQY